MQYTVLFDNYNTHSNCQAITKRGNNVMTIKQTELEKRNLARLSNQQAKLITKACFQSALIQLLDKKDINDISISELTRKAGVSRTAFYSHYQTVDDVLSEIIDEELTVRRVTLSANNLKKEEDNYEQFDIFTDPEKEEQEKRLQNAMLAIQDKYGKNAILKGTNLLDGATTIARNGQIGGHKS